MSRYVVVLIGSTAADVAATLSVVGRGLVSGWRDLGGAVEAGIDLATVSEAKTLQQEIEAALADLAIDCAVLPAEGRRKRLLVADMESTIIEQELLDELADIVGCKNRVAGITARAMRGEIAFRDALRERVALLEGHDAHILDHAFERVTLMPGAEMLVATMREAGASCALVSGGFTVFADPVAARLGFQSCHANTLETIDGKLTGRVREPVLGRAEKLSTLERLCADLDIPLESSLAVGDGANDLDMILGAGLGVAFRAKPVVAAEARARIRHGDLTALLYLQGFHRDDFALR